MGLWGGGAGWRSGGCEGEEEYEVGEDRHDEGHVGRVSEIVVWYDG